MIVPASNVCWTHRLEACVSLRLRSFLMGSDLKLLDCSFNFPQELHVQPDDRKSPPQKVGVCQTPETSWEAKLTLWLLKPRPHRDQRAKQLITPSEVIKEHKEPTAANPTPAFRRCRLSLRCWCSKVVPARPASSARGSVGGVSWTPPCWSTSGSASRWVCTRTRCCWTCCRTGSAPSCSSCSIWPARPSQTSPPW